MRVVIAHRTAAGDAQHAIRGQRPRSVLSASPGGDLRSRGFSRHICDAVFLGVSLRAGVFKHGQGHALRRVLEDVPANAVHTIGNVEVFQLRICLEHILAKAGETAALADRHLRQILAEIECVAVDLRDRIRDRDLRQAAVTKGTPTDPLQLRAFFKGHALQLAAPVEIEFADVGDIFADHKPLDLSVVLTDRSHAAEFIVIHSSAATDDHRSVAVENIDRRLPAQARIDHIRSRAADKLPVFKFTRQAAHLIDALIGKTVAVDRIHFIGQCDRTGNGNAANKVTVSARLQILCPAGVLTILCANRISADLTGELIRIAVIRIGMLIVLTDRDCALGILVEDADGAVGGHVVGRDGRLIAVGRDIHIDALKVERRDVKVEIGVIHNGVGLAAGGAADVVHRAVFVDLTVGQRRRAGIAVVVAGEVEVDSGRVARRGQVLLVDLTAAGGVRVVGRHVRHQHLPGTGALCRVLHQPLSELLKGILIRGVVQHGNVHIPALHRVPRCGNAEHALCGDGIVAAVVRLVVSDDMDHIRIPDTVQSKQIQSVLPLVVVADVVYRVTELNAKVIPAGQLRSDAAHAFKGSFLLNVRQQEEPCLCLGYGHGKAAGFGPDRAVADPVVVGVSGCQPLQGHGVDAVDELARAIRDQAAHALYIRRPRHIGVGRDLNNGLRRAVRRIAHPGDGLSVSGRSNVVDDVIGCTALVTHGIIGIQRDLIRAVALLVGCAQIHASLTRGQGGNIEPSAAVSHTQKHIISIHTDAGRSLTVLNDGNDRGSRTADDRGIRSDAVDSLNGVIFHRRREAGGILVHFANAHSLRLLAAVGTLCDANVDAAALDHGGGNVHRDRGQSTGSIHIVVDPGDAHRDHTLGRIIIISTVDAVGESHRGRILTGQRNVSAQGCDRCRIAAVELHHPRLSHNGCALNIQRHAGQLCIVRNHGEVPCLAGDITVAVLEIERDRVQSLAKVHERRGAAENVLVVSTAIRTVKVEIRGLHTRCKGIRLLVIVVGNEEAQVTGVERHAVLQLGLGTVVVHELNGVHRRRGDILIVGAIDDAEVIEQDIALEVALVQLDAIGGVPADAAGRDHRTEQHTAVDADQCASILGQVSLQILPASLQPLAAARAAVAEVDVGVRPARPAVGAGGDLRTQPRDGDALGDVDPHAEGGGCAVDGEVIAEAETRAVGTGQAGPVILQLDGIVAEADDIGKFLISIGHHGALHHAAAASVVIRRHGVGRHAGKALHGGADGRIVPRISVAAVQDHRRLHADIHRDGGGEVAALGGDGGAAGILHVVRDRKHVARKGARACIGDTPVDVTVLEVDSFRLIGRLEAKVTALAIVQVDLTGGKGQLVGVLDMERGGAHGPPAADQAHRHVADLAGGNKGGGGAATVYGGGGHRAHGLIADGEAHVLRQSLGGSTGEVHGVRRQGDGGAGGIVLIAGGNGGVVKLTGGRHGGNDQNCTGDNALAAAGRGVAHGQVALTLPLGDVGGGAALVELDRRHAAESHHHLCLLGRGIAHGAGRHCAVGLEQDDRSVGLHAHAGAGIAAAVAGLGDDDLAVPHHGDQRVHGLQDLYGRALLLALAGLGLRKGRALLEDVDRAVIKRSDKGAAGVVVVHHAVHHQIAGGFAGIDVEPRSVDASHYVQSCLIFVDMGLIRGGFQGPALLLGVAVAVAGHDLCAAARGVHLHDVGNGLRIAGVIVGDDDSLGNIRSDRVVSQRRHGKFRPVDPASLLQTGRSRPAGICKRLTR